MTTLQIVLSILGAGGLGGLVSAIVSSVVAARTQRAIARADRKARGDLAKAEREARDALAATEREARRKELLLAKAVDIAKAHTDVIMKIGAARIAANQTFKMAVNPDVYAAADQYRWLTHLLDKGELPAEALERKVEIDDD